MGQISDFLDDDDKRREAASAGAGALQAATPQPAVPPAAPPASAAQPESEISRFLADAPPPARGLKGWAQDIGATAVKGLIGAAEAGMGLTDLATGGLSGRAAEGLGLRFKDWREKANDWHSEATKEAQRQYQQAEGVTGKVAAALQNPSVIASAVGEALPMMFAGGLIGRGLMLAGRAVPALAGRIGPALAGALGEGIVGAGSAAEQIRQESPDGLLTGRQAGLAGLSGVADAGFGLLGGKMAQRLGIGDVETMLAGAGRAAAKPAAQPVAKGLPRQMAQGALSEGVLEELPQSVSEQALQNMALDRPWQEDVDSAAVLGTLSGGVMGAGASGLHGLRSRPAGTEPLKPSQRMGLDANAGQLSAAAVVAVDSGASPAALAAAAQQGALQESAEAQQAALAAGQAQGPREAASLERVAALDEQLAAARQSLAALDAQAAAPDGAQDEPQQAARAQLAQQVQQLQAERESLTQDWPRMQAGKALSFGTESGAQLAGHWALAEADQLVTSHDEGLRQNPAYPQQLQPRERSRAASEAQIARMAQRLQPERLAHSADAATGAPIVGADGLVESGNARSIALKRVYAGQGPQAAAYKDFLQAHAAEFGLTPEQVAGMQKPVLVRVRDTPVNRAEFARQANAPTVAMMSPAEQARADAARMDSMDGLEPDESGDFSGAASRGFVRRFMARLPVSEQAAMVDADGRLSSAGYARVRNAVLAKAWGTGEGGSDALARMTESLDDNTRSISRALMMAAPETARMREAIAAGARHDADIAGDVAAAAQEISRLREAGQSVQQALAQTDAFGDKHTPEARALMQFMADNARRPKRIAQLIQAYWQALDAAGDPHQQGMFGGQAAPTKQALLQAAMRQVQDAPAQGAAQERAAPEREVQESAAQEKEAQEGAAQEREAQDRAQAAWNALPPEGRHQLALAAGVQGVVARNAARHADWSGLPAAMQQRLAQAVKADVTQQKEGAQLETGKPAVAPTPGTYALNTSAASAPSVASAGAADGLQSRDAGHDGREGLHQKATPGAQQQFEQTAAEYGGRAAYEKARAAGRTKLDWRQWVQVRTPAFKAWFGDWQAARAKKALQAMPPVEVPRDGVLEKGVMAVARQRAREMYRQLGTAETADGRVVRFPMSGFKETAQHAADRRVLLVIPRLPVLLEQAHHLWTEPSSKANKPNVLAFHHYGVKASFGGRQAFVRLVLREDNDGHVYYDNDATSIEALDAEKAPADERQPDRKPNPGEGAEGLSGNRLAQWWQSVKPENVSKVIDPQTGEPLVVYHGSRWAGFTQFGMGSVGATAGTGAFFTESARVASTFSGTNEAARLPPASQAQNDGYINERRWHRGNYAVFLNIRAPAIYDFQGRKWDKYPAKVPWHSSDAGSLPWHVVDEYANRLALFATQEEAEKFAHERGDAVALHNDEIVESTDSLARHARRHGNADGALFQNVVDGGRGPDGNAPGTVWVAFRGDQIKSATDNTGAFDAAHDDIRFSREQAATESLPGRRVSGTDTASGVERSGSSGPADAASVAPLTDDARAAVLQGPPVASLSGDEAPRAGMQSVRQWATRLFAAQGGLARNPEIGPVVMDARSVRDSMAHGKANPFKYAAFAAVKDVLEQGVLVANSTHGNLDSFYISAPVQIAGTDDVVTVLVHRDPKDQRMYLHSVATKEYLLNRRVSGADAKAASGHSGSSSSGDAASVAPAGAPGKLPGHHVAQRLHELLTRRMGAASAAPGRDNAGHETAHESAHKSAHESGVPRGLAARETADSRQLEGIINRDLERSGQEAAFKALAVGADQLPDALRGALAAFERATGARAVVFRNLTPHVADFNGVTVRDGTLFINETSQSPVTGVAAHEWLHNLRRTHPALYHELAAEVARQGDAQGFARQWGYAPGEAQEELTAAAVGDAMTDPQFLARLAEKDGSLFARVAKSFLAFLDTLTARWRSQGSNAYLRDVQAFRDKLAAVLQAYEQQAGQAGGVGQAGLPQAMFQRVWHGTPHKGIEKTGFRLDKIGTGEGLQVYGHGIYFASRREVAEFYRGMRQGQVRLDGRLMTDGHHRGAASTGDAEVDALLLDAQGDVDKAIAWARDFGQDAQAAKLERLRGRVQRGEPGQLYAAEIPEDDDLLDWDKPLDEQPAKVRRALLELAGGLPADGRAAFRQAMARRATGQDVYAFLAQRAAGADASAEGVQKGQRAASELLLAHGIPGLRYLDGDSRNAGEGSHNYVIWDEGLLTPEAAQIAPQYSRKQATKAAYERRIDELFAGGHASRQGAVLLDGSDVMGLLGHEHVPLVLNERHLLDGRFSHPEMTAAAWKRVPEWLENPAAVYDDPRHPGRLTVIAPETLAGYPVVMAVELEPDNPHDPRAHQLLVTAFAKTTGDLPALGFLAASGRLQYVDTKTAPVAWPDTGDVPRTAGRAHGARRILTEKSLAAWRKAQAAKAGDAPAFSQPESRASRQVKREASALKVQQAQRLVKALSRGWANAPEVVIASSVRDEALPETARRAIAQQESRSAGGRVEGFYWQGKVYLVAGNLPSMHDVARVYMHETLGHYGLRGVYGEKLNSILNRTGMAMRGEVIERARQYGFHGLGAAARTASDAQVWDSMTDKQKLDSAEEALAYLAQTGGKVGDEKSLGLLRELVAAIRSWLRAHVPVFANLRYSDDEIMREFILPARRWVKNGSGQADDASDVMFQLAWHGTPYRGIEKTGFKLNKIGTGEGAQAYGWGIYFASQRHVAEEYRRNLTRDTPEARYEMLGKHKDMLDRQIRQGGSYLRYDEQGRVIAQGLALKDGADMKGVVIQPYSKWKLAKLKKQAAELEAQMNELRALLGPGGSIAGGQLYQTEVPEDKDLLIWDSPWNKQPLKVRRAVVNFLRQVSNGPVHPTQSDISRIHAADALKNRIQNRQRSDALTGKDLYTAFRDIFGGPKAASEALRAAGVPGLRYLDGMSRAGGEGTYNYVIWDEALLTPEAAQIAPQYSRKQATKAAYERRIDALFAGAKPALQGVRVLDRSDVLGLLGFENRPVVLAEGKVKAGQANHPRMSAAIWKQVPEWLENPAAVFDSDTDEGLVFLAPEMLGDAPISVIVRPDAQQTGDLQAHLLLNAYDRSSSTPFMRWLRDGLLRFADTKKFPALFESASGRRLPGTALQNKPGTARILTEKNLAGWRRANPDAGAPGDAPAQAAWDFGGRSVQQLQRDYARLPGTDAGHVIDVDMVRELSPQYRADRSQAARIHRAASDLGQKLFAQALARPVAQGRDPVAVFTAGGGGSGKSTAIRQLLGEGRADVTLDGTLSKLERARQQVQAALDSGRNVQIRYVYRSPAKAAQGAIERAIASGRPVPVDVLAQAHANAPRVVKALAQEYAGHEKVEIIFIHNDGESLADAFVAPVEEIPDVDEQEARRAFESAVDAAWRAHHAPVIHPDPGQSAFAGRAPVPASAAQRRDASGANALGAGGFSAKLYEAFTGHAPPGDEQARFSRRAPEPSEPRPDEAARLKESALEQLDRVFKHPGTVSWWHKTVGTMRNLAERQPLFKPVYEAAQQFIDDVSHFANDAADFAPRLLPRLESWRDLGKRAVSAADSQAVAAPLFEGTLSYTRGKDGSLVKTDNVDAAGVVFTDAELKGRFGLTPAQIELYRQARAAIDRSIDTTARADILRLAGRDFAHLRQAVMDAPDLRAAAVQVVEAMQEVMQSDAKRREAMRGAIEAAQERVQTAQALMQRGYAPLTRFGRYTLDVVDAQGQRQYFGLYESRREANVAAIHMRSQYPGAQVTQGTLSDDAYKLFAGITPESLELFGDLLAAPGQGKDKGQDKAFQAWLQLARNNRSAIKRLIHRKGVAGYSQDAGRVLASFIYANARQTAGALNAGRMDRAIAAIPKEQGQLRDVAMALRDYTQNPREEGQAIRGMLFAQYLGGSLASAAVNMTQPFAVTLPWLSQFGGMRQAAAQMTRALADMTRPGHRYEADLARDMAKAEEDGVVSPQEIHQLMAQARGAGALRSGDGTRRGDALAAAANAWERLKVAWGQPFALAEQFNRRSTYIAAWRLARQQGMADADAFARRAVLETQFVYTKANKPRWGRGAVGGALFTFKTYSVSYLELMHRMWTQGGTPGKQGVAWMLAMLLLMGGAGGLPFMEDAEDLIDGLAQLAGYNTSVKQWRRQALQDIVGNGLAEFIESGVSGLPGAPIDISGRLGMGNLLPGTGLLLTKQNRERDLLDVAGPAGDLLARGFAAGRKLLTGDAGGAAMELAPTAVRNLAKGADMLATGSYRDAKGYKVLDTTALEALAKAAGFQPRSVAQVQEGNSFLMRSKSFYQHTSAEIKAQWARALFEKDEAALQRVRQRVADWNRRNPEQPITVRMPDIWRRVREMGKERSQRIADSAPRALRQQMRQALAQEG